MNLSTNSKNILVTDYTWPDTTIESNILKEYHAQLIHASSGDEAELKDLVITADAILTCFAHITSEVIKAGHNLQVISRYGIGVDNISVETATERGIIVTNVPAYCVDEVAEYTLSCILSFARNLIQYNIAIRQSDWSLADHRKLYRVSGKTLGIIGFGSIGQTVATKAQALGLNILIFDRQPNLANVRSVGGSPVSLEALLAKSDYVSLHIPLTPETYQFIGRDELKLMKKTALLINSSRGAIVDLQALVEALNGGNIAGAALDVFEPERIPAEHPIFQFPNVITTPHTAFYSEESLHNLRVRAAKNVAAVLQGIKPDSIVNPEVLKSPKWATLR